MFPAYLNPEPNQLPEGDRQRSNAKELAPSMQPRVMMNAYFHYTPGRQLQFSNQLDTDRPAGRDQMDVAEQFSANQTVITVDVPDLDAK